MLVVKTFIPCDLNLSRGHSGNALRLFRKKWIAAIVNILAWSRYSLVSRRPLPGLANLCCYATFHLTWWISMADLLALIFRTLRKKHCEFQSLQEVNSCHLNLATNHNSDTDSTLYFPLKGAKGNYHGVARQLFLAPFWHSQHLFSPATAVNIFFLHKSQGSTSHFLIFSAFYM